MHAYPVLRWLAEALDRLLAVPWAPPEPRRLPDPPELPPASFAVCSLCLAALPAGCRVPICADCGQRQARIALARAWARRDDTPDADRLLRSALGE